MKFSLFTLATFLSLALAKAPIKNPDAKDAVADSYIVVYKAGTSTSARSEHESKVDRAAKRKNKKGVGVKYNVGFNGYQIDIASEDLDKVLNDPAVEFVEKDLIVRASAPVVSARDEPSKFDISKTGHSFFEMPHTRRRAAEEQTAEIQIARKNSLITQSNAPWGLARISHRKAGATSYTSDRTTGNGIKVYVLDTGIFTGHSVWYHGCAELRCYR
jgi:hypothetical protein